jgi:hypothetical protein
VHRAHHFVLKYDTAITYYPCLTFASSEMLDHYPGSQLVLYTHIQSGTFPALGPTPRKTICVVIGIFALLVAVSPAAFLAFD